MNNTINFYGSSEGAKEFLNSSIKSASEVIAHYDFVINDISSDISDPILETSKAPTIQFLKAMRTNWSNFKEDLQNKLNVLEKR